MGVETEAVGYACISALHRQFPEDQAASDLPATLQRPYCALWSDEKNQQSNRAKLLQEDPLHLHCFLGAPKCLREFSRATITTCHRTEQEKREKESVPALLSLFEILFSRKRPQSQETQNYIFNRQLIIDSGLATVE